MRTLSRILPTGTLKVLARRVLGLEIRFALNRKYEIALYWVMKSPFVDLHYAVKP